MIDRIKSDIAAKRIQVALIDGSGRLEASCHTHIDLRHYVGEELGAISPIFEGLTEPILQLEVGGPAFHIPMLTFSLDGKEYDLNFEFYRREEDPECIIWLMSVNKEFNYKLQQMQQERNDSVIHLETIRRQQIELELVNERLEIMNQGLDRFAYIVSHDLKSPLRAIGNLAEWIGEGVEEGDLEEVGQHLGLLKTRIRRMESLIEGILDYSRAGRIHAEKVDVDVAHLIREIVESNHAASGLQLQLADDLPTLHASRTSLYQVFANLISNAIKYNDKEVPVVDISAVLEREFLKFTVADNGPGIDQKHHDRIFEIFGTLQSQDGYESTGIGLTIVQKIVEDAGGTVQVDSALGEGAKFIFTWPREALVARN